jgi:hypothetical protein
MFRLHEQTRRRIGFALFLLSCVVPTALVIARCVERNLPGYARVEADRLSQRLGAQVAIDGFLHPKPGRAVYEGLRICDAETGREILRCRRIEVDEHRGTLSMTLSATGLEIRIEQWQQVWLLLDQMLSCRAGWSGLDVQFRMERAVLSVAEERRGLDQIEGRLQTAPAGSQVELTFRLAGVEMPEPARLRIVRNRRTDPPETGFEWKTGGGAVPCSILPPSFGLVATAGPNSWLRGYGWANQTAKGWTGEAAGQLLQADLDQLVTSRFPHTLSGQAHINVDALRFHQSRIQHFQGAVQAGPGIVSRRLVDALIGQLGLAGPGEPSQQSLVPYQQLALVFLLDSRGLQLRGRCDGNGTILTGRHGPLVADPAAPHPLPLADLLQVLMPGTPARVPAAPEIEPLLLRLPFPATAGPKL